MLVPHGRGDSEVGMGGASGGGGGRERVEVVVASAAKNLVSGLEVLNRKTSRVKFNGN